MFLLGPTENILFDLKCNIWLLQEWWGGKDTQVEGVRVLICPFLLIQFAFHLV